MFEQTFPVENGTYGTQSMEQSELPKTGVKRKLDPSPLLAMNDKVFPENPQRDGPTCAGCLSFQTPSRIALS